MGFANYIWEWEGDETQAFGEMFWKSKEFLYPKKIRFAACRIIFITGDLDEYQALLDEREAIIKRNLDKLATGAIGTIGGTEGGFIHAHYPIAGDNLEDVPAEPTYAGELSLIFKLYCNDILRHTKQLYTTEIFKLPGGYRGRRHFFTLEGNVERIKRVDLATSIWELKHDQGEFGG
jgi:hypothetical protein